MQIIHRFQIALLGLTIALLTACNPVPLSVVASDFSINGVKGTNTASSSTATTAAATGTTGTAGTTSTTTTTTGTTATTGTTTATSTNLSALTTPSTTTVSEVQNVTIDLTSKEACSDLTSLVLAVQLDEGVTISPTPGIARDYSSPVAFTVTESYGTKVSYLLTVKGKSCATTKATTTTTNNDGTTTTTTCSIASVGATGYSLVFKACDANKLATYYDKTECVRDNATGLIWEGKTASGLRAVNNTYNNVDNTSLLQIAANTVPGTTALPARAPTQAEIDAPDNATGYANTVNALNLCGASRWRLPTVTELQTLRLAGTTTQIDMDWFSATNFNGSYATSTQYGALVERASVVQFYNKGASAVDNLLRDGTVWHPTLGALAFREHSVRLVRSAF